MLAAEDTNMEHCFFPLLLDLYGIQLQSKTENGAAGQAMLLEMHMFGKFSLQKSFKSSTKPSACPTKRRKTSSFTTSHKVSSSTVSVQKTPPKPRSPQTHNHQH